MRSPAEYEAWYQTPRGAWIADREFNLMMTMMGPRAGESLLDVGCGTGHFTRRFARAGLHVTGVDPDRPALEFAHQQRGDIDYFVAAAEALPYKDASFDYCSAVTSLCFVAEPERALSEMWRVCRKGVVLGLLNRNSLLYRERDQHPGYAGARWDTVADVAQWIDRLASVPRLTKFKSAVFCPRGNVVSRIVESIVPSGLLRGAFLAVYLCKSG